LKEVAVISNLFFVIFSDVLVEILHTYTTIIEIFIFVSANESFISASASFIGEKFNISAKINVISAN
jgi:hypothetical protein